MEFSFSQPLMWVLLAVGIVAVFMILEVILRTLINRYSTPQTGYPHRTGRELPRVPRHRM